MTRDDHADVSNQLVSSSIDYMGWCSSLSCTLDSLIPRGQANGSWLALRGQAVSGNLAPTLIIFTPGGGGEGGA